ncbi:SCO family protein [Stenotrophomonas sp. SY1]|uniref:SCO family protein n=1 Tax=Stenotrophomonas sp. SY1 TaxID=477235 RepID=UPI001E2E99E5|nr:SCO family protein [Stenotrophomonas sp. SY1]MCD9088147.1 SCO family protein [Stenotrophomonas sp. SY1]
MSRYRSPAIRLAALARKLRLSTVLVAAASVLLVACAAKPKVDFYGKDIACEELGQHWTLPDSSGVTRSPTDFHGKVTYLFFGFTSCPDVCPTTMVELNRVKHLMGSDADNLQVVFVTVDPARDTPAVAETYVKAFDPTATALIGNDAQLAAMASSFKAFYEREDGSLPGTYTMTHTSGGYVFDRQGQLRLFAPFGMPVEQLFSDVQRLTLEPKLPVGQQRSPGCRVTASG